MLHSDPALERTVPEGNERPPLTATPVRAGFGPPPLARDRHARRNPGDDRLALGLLLALPLSATLFGLPYYLLSPGARLRSPLHVWLRPSAGLGLAFGIIGLALFLFMWLYPLRKRFRWLSFTGSTPAWLRVHVVIGLSLPFLVAVHAGWRFEGLIGLGYAAMVVVCVSGFVGRYLYVRIPRSQGGLELTLDQVTGERRAIITRIAAATGHDPGHIEREITIDSRPVARLGPWRALRRLAADDVARSRRVRALKREWVRPRTGVRPIDRRELATALKLARREIALAQQAHMLEATRRLFGYWHVAHLPVALTALIAVLIHVAVAVFVGGVGLRGIRP